MTKTYKIHEVSEMTGIPRNTLINWDRRGKIAQVQRDESNRRSYSLDDIKKIIQTLNPTQKAKVKRHIETKGIKVINKLLVLNQLAVLCEE
jgi:DNA-binding transcriptional MerR regulator